MRYQLLGKTLGSMLHVLCRKWLKLLLHYGLWVMCGLLGTGNNMTSRYAHAAINSAATPTSFKPLNYSVIQTYAHQPKAFTQGWLLEGDDFYESSGLYRQSYVVRYNRNNTVQQRVSIPNHLFAEGLTLLNNELYLLSWQAGRALVLDPTTLHTKRSYHYRGEGWGLTHDGQSLIMSNGSNQLQLRHPKTFKITRQMTVQGGAYDWQRLNELEFAKGIIWANIWQSPIIAAIDPDTGAVLGTVNLKKLVKANTQHPSYQSLNGIAYDAKHDAFWVTGKEWPKRYLIKIDILTTP
ncbi:glutaminyl-peptide cyclotransferase [Marinagarivorans algicola]|uniref:glutaminyl-peptide cyclotransferase n=1 Tax=Marinagarivorans algicola TaxID=1513270 RepID=UPI000B22436E|nr:glutaminyl-peptide cyclotransferase [Marinagarivorans algicola]